VAAALAWRPEWPAVVVVVVAWGALVIAASGSAGHGAHPLTEAQPAIAASLGAPVATWALMCVAMMCPATLPAVRHVGLNSARRRRRWAMAVYLGSYLGVWIAFGALALALVAAADSSGVERPALVLGTLALAAWWQTTRLKRRALIACRRAVPLPPSGWRADRGCIHFGLRQASRCIVSSWPLMLLMAVLGHHNLPAMAAVTCFIIAEERGLIRDPLPMRVTFSFAVATIGVALLGAPS
jgi:predicted metal-binding membrane protein